MLTEQEHLMCPLFSQVKRAHYLPPRGYMLKLPLWPSQILAYRSWFSSQTIQFWFSFFKLDTTILHVQKRPKLESYSSCSHHPFINHIQQFLGVCPYSVFSVAETEKKLNAHQRFGWAYPVQFRMDRHGQKYFFSLLYVTWLQKKDEIFIDFQQLSATLCLLVLR